MSTEIDVRLWSDNNSLSVEEKFYRILNSVSSWSQVSHQWQGLRILDRTSNKVVLNISELLSLSDLQKAARGYDSSTFRLSTGIGFKCWRFSGKQAERGWLRLQVESWGYDYATRNGRDWHIEGDASLSIKNCGPYCAILDSDSNVDVNQINGYVEENLEDLTSVLFHTIENMEPNSMKVFTDAGEFILFNAHLAYYREQLDIIKDLQYLAQIWEYGLPNYNLRPLKLLDPERQDFIFHNWRTPQQRKELWENIISAIQNVKLVSNQTLQSVLNSGRFDTYEIPVGFTLLEYPYFFNAFLDRFYLEVLNYELQFQCQEKK